MDPNMPVLDGFEATEGVREVSLETQVVVVTASASPDDWAKALEAGASALRKGCFAAEPFKAIFAVVPLRRAPTERQPAPPAPQRGEPLRLLAARATRGLLALP
jgi:CheY-like chemotaxis protein